MQALNIIRSEHRNLGAILYTLEHLAGEIRAGKAPDFKLLHGMLTYIDRFLNTFHHPKEEAHLMPALAKRLPSAEDRLNKIHAEHHQGEKLFNRMLKALSALEFTGDLEYARFDQAVTEYVKFEFAHAKNEEEKILPLAEQHLTAEDWESIDLAFNDNQDPLFGDQPAEEFQHLYTAIVSTVPEPFGLGKQWQPKG